MVIEISRWLWFHHFWMYHQMCLYPTPIKNAPLNLTAANRNDGMKSDDMFLTFTAWWLTCGVSQVPWVGWALSRDGGEGVAHPVEAGRAGVVVGGSPVGSPAIEGTVAPGQGLVLLKLHQGLDLVGLRVRPTPTSAPAAWGTPWGGTPRVGRPRKLPKIQRVGWFGQLGDNGDGR